MVDGDNHKEVGEKILDVYSNSGKYESSVEKGYELSKKYTWDKVAERTYEVFEKVSKKNR
jgi:glycosyltransferase involved in cell wall biosynthesis